MNVVPAANLDLAQWIRPGDTVLWTHATGEPLVLTEALVAQRHRFAPFRAFLGVSFSKTFLPEHADAMSFVGFGAVGHNREFVKAGLLDLIPAHLSDAPRLFRDGPVRPDVVFVQLSEGPDGALSMGAVNIYVGAAMAHARVVIAEINERAPFTHSVAPVDPSRIACAVRSNRPLLQVPSRPPEPIDTAIAQHVVPWIRDGAVLQVGIGNIPNAVLAGLRSHRDLGIHSGVIGDNVLTELIESGAVTNATKRSDRGITVTGGLFGTDRLYAWADRNPSLRVDPVEYTHDARRVSELESFVTINSALEVDLTGQINGETAGRHYIGTIGGQTDFIRAALATPQGRSIIALPSRTDKGGSRIVGQIAAGVTSTARADADVFATEQGAVSLRGLSITERVRAMLSIAHPDHREALERQAREVVAGYR